MSRAQTLVFEEHIMKLFNFFIKKEPLTQKPPTEKGKTGALGEALAKEYLENLGYKLKDKNFRHSHSETDLIMQDGNCIVFCEVRTQSVDKKHYKTPAESISDNKKLSLAKGASYYMARHYHDSPINCRFDVVEVFLEKGGLQKINHIKNAFYAPRKTLKGTRYKSCKK